ncbi:MAG TPA: MBL fold metallo-hydrolase, partial [Syntrophaceae bacterium]|nr:MBL fold metallo-hydrolase [Syntrophaceae bacterium]
MHMKSDRLFRSLVIFLGGVFLSFFTTLQVYAEINLTFLGAAEQVSGSCILFETGYTKFLVDCGLFFPEDEGLDIEARRQNAIHRNESIYFDPAKLDLLLLTHAHSDHCGRLPLIIRRGFKGKIYCTKPTEELLKIQLSSILEHHGGFGEETFIKSKKSHVLHPDSECPWVKKIKPENKEVIKFRREDISLFDKRLSVCNVCIRKEVKSVLEKMVAIDYRKKYRLSPDVEVRAKNTGHILGSAMYEIWIKTGSKEVKFVCTGDIGNRSSPMLKEPAIISEADYIIMESTYGNRSRRISDNPFNSFLKQLETGIRESGIIIIPARALDRTQRVLYVLQNAKRDRIIPEDIKVYLTSRTAERCNQIYMNFFSHDVKGYFDQRIWSLREN